MHGTLFTRLPTEIKSIIFVHSLPPIKSVLDIKSPSKSEAPLNLSHVCKQWRDISLSTPSLWARICLCIPLLQSNWVLTCVPMFIGRSGNCGLSIRVCSGAWRVPNTRIAVHRGAVQYQNHVPRRCHFAGCLPSFHGLRVRERGGREETGSEVHFDQVSSATILSPSSLNILRWP